METLDQQVEPFGRMEIYPRHVEVIRSSRRDCSSEPM